jgi:hypothetical protein
LDGRLGREDGSGEREEDRSEERAKRHWRNKGYCGTTEKMEESCRSVAAKRRKGREKRSGS